MSESNPNGERQLRVSYASQEDKPLPSCKGTPVSYQADRVIGKGSFGVVFQATVVDTGEVVAIKKVLQDRRFQNRELDIMQMLSHPCIIPLKHCFYSTESKNNKKVFLNVVMEYIPQTIYRSIRSHTKRKRRIPMTLIKIYIFQLLRACAYMHSKGICHRDIKPQNVLLHPETHIVKLCDFGSAKVLQSNKPNVAYICSRFYRAPELVFEASHYTTAVDVWSVGCVLGEFLSSTPIFPGNTGMGQLVEIMKVLGTPSPADIKHMNPKSHLVADQLPQFPAKTWNQIYGKGVPHEACDLLGHLLRYQPNQRPDALAALGHPFFDELRNPNTRLPNGLPLPDLFNFTHREVQILKQRNLEQTIVPSYILTAHARQEAKLSGDHGTSSIIQPDLSLQSNT